MQLQLEHRMEALEHELSMMKAKQAEVQQLPILHGLVSGPGKMDSTALAFAAPCINGRHLWGSDIIPASSPVHPGFPLAWASRYSQDADGYWSPSQTAQRQGVSNGTSGADEEHHSTSQWTGQPVGYAGYQIEELEGGTPEEASSWNGPMENLPVEQHQDQLRLLRREEAGAIVMLKHTTALARMYRGRAIECIRRHFEKLGVTVKLVSLYMHFDIPNDAESPNPRRNRSATYPRPPQVGYLVLNSAEDAEAVLKFPSEHIIDGAAVCVERFNPELAWRERL